MEKLQKNENIISNECLTVPDDTNLIIDDLGISTYVLEKIESLSNRNLIFFNFNELNQKLLNLISVKLVENPLVVCPNFGSLPIYNQLKNSVSKCYSVNTERDRPNSIPNVNFPKNLINILKNNGAKSEFIVDDVIVTGSTVNKIAEMSEFYFNSKQITIQPDSDIRFGWTSSYYPNNLKISIASWFLYDRKNKNQDNLNRFDKIFTAIRYKGGSGQPPINSLSTLTGSSDKSEVIRNIYANKFSDKPDELIDLLKGGVRICK
ncbi:MAG TPA: phosphoribosyltransferase [Patescibacteria group bacterium]|nr:phosphoribosyltransferase [Patescibacteria group bacterium]